MSIRAFRILVAGVAAIALSAVAAPTAMAVPVGSAISFTSSTIAQVGVYNTLSVSISSSDGVTRPTGGVQFFNTQGQLVGSASTTAVGAAGASASIPWVPTQATTYAFNATFTSSNPAVMTGSTTAAPITIQATPTGQVVSIAATQMYMGIPTTLTATVFPPTLQGSVAFSVNELKYGVGPSIPVVNGAASQTFTPTGIGWQQYIVSFTASNSPGTQGAASQWVNVLPPLGRDTITLSPTPSSLANGTSVALVATTSAGGQPTLAAAGGCRLSGTTLIATSGSGTCIVTGSVASTGGYLGTTATWPISLTPGVQTAAIAAPPSGRLAVGRTVTLTRSGTVTNAGQAITWRITGGSSVCSLSRKSGATRLTMDAAGRCQVRGQAPAVPGQWNAYSVQRTYTAS